MGALQIVPVFLLLAMAAGDAPARICPKNKNFPFIEKGMALNEVTGLIGKPISAESGPDDSKVLFYCLASSFLDSDGSDTREYWVQTVAGRVIGYGERSDAATMQRAQRQYTAAWASANMIVNSANQAADRTIGAGAPAVGTQIKVEQTTIIQQLAPVPEAEDQSKRNWHNWKPF